MTTGLQINVTYGNTPKNQLPAGMSAAIDQVVAYFGATFTNPITLNIEIDMGSPPGDGMYTDRGTIEASYSTIRADLIATSSIGEELAQVLPTNDPISDAHSYVVSLGQAKVLGILVDNPPAVDATITVSNLPNHWDFNPSDGISAGQLDFVGALEHEITEALGRTSKDGLSLPNVGPAYYPLDLLRYSAPGQLQTGTGDPSYFSLDGGVSNLGDYNNFVTGSLQGDLGDWSSNDPPNSFSAAAPTGTLLPLTSADMLELEAIGLTPVDPAVSSNELAGLKQGLDAVFNRLESALGSQFYAEELPLIGTQLETEFNAGQNELQSATVLEGLVDAALNTLAGSATTASAIQNAIDTSLSSNGFTGLGVYVGQNGSGNLYVNFDTTDLQNLAGLSLAGNLGLDGISLNATGTISATLSAHFTFTADISPADPGDSSTFSVETPTGPQTSDLTVGVGFTAADVAASAQIGDLTINADDVILSAPDTTVTPGVNVGISFAPTGGAIAYDKIVPAVVNASLVDNIGVQAHLASNSRQCGIAEHQRRSGRVLDPEQYALCVLQ